jgi:hypothetical protein
MTTTQQIADKLNSNVAQTRGRFSFTRQDYIDSLVRRYPEAELQVFEAEEIVAYKFINDKGYYGLLAFVGRANKPVIHSVYAGGLSGSSEEVRDAALENLLANKRSHIEYAAKRKAEKKAAVAEGHGVQVGDIFVASWGYDQTNLNWYQVTKLIGKTMVEIREIGDVIDSTPHFTYANKKAVKDSFLTKSHLNNYNNNEPVRKKVNVNVYGGNKSVSISVFSHANAYLWDGKAEYETNSQFGH